MPVEMNRRRTRGRTLAGTDRGTLSAEADAVTAPSSRKPLPAPSDDGEPKPARKRMSIDEILPPRDLGPWPEGLTLSREKDGFADRY